MRRKTLSWQPQKHRQCSNRDSNPNAFCEASEGLAPLATKGLVETLMKVRTLLLREESQVTFQLHANIAGCARA